jgi:pimeloyl-ACP methyl ester carboxylesterase
VTQVQPVLLIHGAATTSRIWDQVREVLAHHPDLHVSAPERACSGSLAQETADLRPGSAGAVVVGVSGGATLGLALVAAGAPLRAAILHEPAVGSLGPGLLDQVVAAYAADGVAGFGSTLYGPSWRLADAPADPDCVRRDLGMFRQFEPGPAPRGWAGRVIITVGASSPDARYEAAQRLGERFGYEIVVLPGSGHAAHLDAPQELARLVEQVVRAR